MDNDTIESHATKPIFIRWFSIAFPSQNVFNNSKNSNQNIVKPHENIHSASDKHSVIWLLLCYLSILLPDCVLNFIKRTFFIIEFFVSFSYIIST